MSEYSGMFELSGPDKSLIESALLKNSLINQGYNVPSEFLSSHLLLLPGLSRELEGLDSVVKSACLGIPTTASISVKSTGTGLFHLIFDY